MDLVYDRISNLPDDIIHRILSFLDMKYAIQTCTLSHRWEHIWTSMSHINLDSRMFVNVPKFSKFVEHALSHRNSRAEVTAVDLTFTGVQSQLVVNNIAKYAYAHNARKLTMLWFNRMPNDFPQYLFSSHTLKHLTLNDRCRNSRLPKFAWDFPALETLNLTNIYFNGRDNKSLDLFSKCVNLKDLTFHRVSLFGLDIFNVCAPQLSNLTITDVYTFREVFNVVACQLKNLTFKGSVYNLPFLFLESTEGFDSLEQVNLYLSLSDDSDPNNIMEKYVPRLLSLFQKLRSAKFLTLNGETIKTLSSCLVQLLLEPCPFNNLKCVTIVKVTMYRIYDIKSMATKVKNYLLENSPSATFIMDLQKRSRKQVTNDRMAKKVAKLEAEIQMQTEKRILEEKIQMQNEVIAEQKAMLEAAKLQNEKFMSHIVRCKMAELKLQVESGNPDYEIIRSMGCYIKSVMDLIPESLRVNVETQFFSDYEEVKSVLFTRINANEWPKIEIELKNIMHSQSSCSNNIHNQISDVPAAKLPPAPRPSSANMATSSSVA